MGGAGVPVHQKWRDVWHAKGDEKYIVCNADESEPGTFKDRELLTQYAHLVLEGVILAGLVTGATRGTIYIRHEYAEQIEVMQREIIRAQDLGACGQGIFKSTLNFPVEVFASPGGYICDEQSALIEAMEDRRGQPRNKPPQLETNGLYDKPMLVSNVETFAWALAIMINGGQWYAQEVINGCKGRRFFSISGDVAKPGVYEVPCGVLLGTLSELAGGVVGELKAFAPSGPSGGFLPRMLPVSALPQGLWRITSEKRDAKHSLEPQPARLASKVHRCRSGVVYLLCSGGVDVARRNFDLLCRCTRSHSIYGSAQHAAQALTRRSG